MVDGFRHSLVTAASAGYAATKHQMKRQFAIALVTAPDLKTARKLAQAALKAHLAACVNLVPKIESHYWWKGRLQRGTEVLLVFKSSAHRLAALEKCILAVPLYDTPEFVI